MKGERARVSLALAIINMISKRGIAYNLEITPYIINVRGITYHFSSKNHLEKFTEKLEENREVIALSLSKRFGFDIKPDMLSDLSLYSKVETRGFYVAKGSESYKCKKEVRLSGVNQMSRTLQKPLENLTQSEHA
jgi:Phi-29-like late genes activator (early protein GP4).